MNPLRDFDLQPAGAEAGLVQRGFHGVRQVLALEPIGRHVDRGAQRLRPALRLGASGSEHPGVKLLVKAKRLRDRHEGAGRHLAAARAVPPDQRLEPLQHAGQAIDDGLPMQVELPGVQRFPQVALQFPPVGHDAILGQRRQDRRCILFGVRIGAGPVAILRSSVCDILPLVALSRAQDVQAEARSVRHHLSLPSAKMLDTASHVVVGHHG